jgi:arabinogalactan endo-1,4-beta-galactosidase
MEVNLQKPSSLACLIRALALTLFTTQSALALDYVIGADLSFLKQQEDAGKRFRDSGQVRLGLRIFKDHGYNWVRLRLFHNVSLSPTPLPNNLAYTTAMAKAAKAMGFKFLLDFHYSDTWADPGAQAIPKAWEGLSQAVLIDSVFRYTRDVIRHLRQQDAAPDMVQVGNEINNGFMWPAGQISNWKNFGDLIKAGLRGVDSAFAAAPVGLSAQPRALTMLHIANGGDTAVTKWFFDQAAAQGIVFDIIGQSYYPLWQGTPQDLGRNLAMMSRRYTQDIVVVETAFAPYPEGQGSPFPLTDAGQVAYLRAIDSIVRATPNGRGKGLMWWEPTGDAYLGAPRGLFDRQLNARPALSVFDARVPVALQGFTAKAGFSLPKVLLLERGTIGIGVKGIGRLRADGRTITSGETSSGEPGSAGAPPGRSLGHGNRRHSSAAGD